MMKVFFVPAQFQIQKWIRAYNTEQYPVEREDVGKGIY